MHSTVDLLAIVGADVARYQQRSRLGYDSKRTILRSVGIETQLPREVRNRNRRTVRERRKQARGKRPQGKSARFGINEIANDITLRASCWDQ